MPGRLQAQGGKRGKTTSNDQHIIWGTISPNTGSDGGEKLKAVGCLGKSAKGGGGKITSIRYSE